MEAQGLEPDLRRLLLSHGYIGAGTVSPPTGQLREDLTAYKETGGPSHGAGAASSLAPLPFAELGFDKWKDKLSPDLKRAGPEIYRILRSAGATSVRDWLGQNFDGSSRSTEWTDPRNIATRADSAIASGDNPAQLAVILATNDGLRIDLRRLSAHVYETRTGDRHGAAAMLAVKAPGTHVDIAPTWMVEGASKHSKMEYERTQRVQGCGKGDGDGGGRGRGGGAKGDGAKGDSSSAPAQGQRGRGRGSKGK